MLFALLQIAALVNVISFTATRAGLANQLLSIVIECKLPQVERRRKALVHEEESLKLKLTDLENTLLSQLSFSQGNILENTDLRDALTQTKTSSETVERNLEESRKLKETLERDQAVFAVLASKCCSVYFALQSLPKLNPLYRFSLQTFVGIYRTAVENLAKNEEVKDQLQKFCALSFYQVIHYVYAHVARAVFKKDRLSFALQLVRFVRPELMKAEEWDLLLSGKFVRNEGLGPGDESTLVSWMDGALQNRFVEVLRTSPELKENLQLENVADWKAFLCKANSFLLYFFKF